MIKEIEVNNLLPDEIEKTIKFLEKILGIKEKEKSTLSKLVNRERKNFECPFCESINIVKNGHSKKGVQRYKCKKCLHRFCDTTNTLSNNSKLTYNIWLEFFKCMNDKLSIRKTAAKLQLNKNTIFSMRHKVLKALSTFRENIKLSGEIQCDEKYESINDNIYFKIVGNGSITTKMVKQAFDNHLEKKCVLITDCKSSYEKFCADNKIKLEQVKSGTYKNLNGYNLSEINALHSNLDLFLKSFAGVSTKHLQQYLDWFVYQKYLTYSIEILEQPQVLMNYSLSRNSYIKISDIYSMDFPINIYDVYADYDFTPSPHI